MQVNCLFSQASSGSNSLFWLTGSFQENKGSVSAQMFWLVERYALWYAGAPSIRADRSLNQESLQSIYVSRSNSSVNWLRPRRFKFKVWLLQCLVRFFTSTISLIPLQPSQIWLKMPRNWENRTSAIPHTRNCDHIEPLQDTRLQRSDFFFFWPSTAKLTSPVCLKDHPPPQRTILLLHHWGFCHIHVNAGHF